MKQHIRKITLFSVLIPLLILGISPKVIGTGIQDATIESLINFIPPEAESQLEIRQSVFHNGWFSSQAEVEVLYTPPGMDSISLQLVFDISHGPLLITPRGPKAGLAYASIVPSISSDAFKNAIAELPFALPTISLDLLASFDQSIEIGLDIAPLTYSDPDGEVSFNGLSGTFIVNSDLSAEFSLLMGGLAATENGENTDINISGMEIRSTTAQLNNILAPSEAQLIIPLISSNAPVPFSVSDITTTYGLLASETDEIAIFQNLKINEISSTLPVNSLLWNSEIEEINSELFKYYYQLAAELQNEMSANPEAVTARISQLGQELALAAVQNKLVVNNFVQTNAYDGDHELDLQIRWNGLPELRNIMGVDIKEALNALTVDLELSLNLEAIMRSPIANLVDPYVQQGYIEINNGLILVKGNLLNGLLTFNGNEMPLDQFF